MGQFVHTDWTTDKLKDYRNLHLIHVSSIRLLYDWNYEILTRFFKMITVLHLIYNVYMYTPL